MPTARQRLGIKEEPISFFSNIKEELHRMKVKLYPNYLPRADGAYIARTNNETSLSIEQVCAAAKSRGAYNGDYKDLADKVKKYFDEVAYQLCGGVAVNNGYYSIHPAVGGTFNSVSDEHNHKKNPISFRFRTRNMLRRLAEHIVVDIEGLADGNGFIDEFFDYDEKSSNTVFVPGDQFCISGHKIKIAGDDPSCGLYFVPVDDPSKAVKVNRIAENSRTRITGITPKTEFAQNRLEIRTQFAGSSSYFLKTPRVITSSFILEEA